MVEGPGCKIKGEKIKAKFKGKKAYTVSGNAVERAHKECDKKKLVKTPFDDIIGRQLEDVITLGKELFMFFGDICIRIHFLMAGSHWVNGKKGDMDVSSQAEKPALELMLGTDNLSFHKSSAEIRSSDLCMQRFERLKHLDICSKIFSHKAAVHLMMQQTGRKLCDVLLDQDILPGVGNIIKNEGLFDSGIKPDVCVENLTEAHVLHLIHMVRDFSMLFYKCRKTGEALHKYYKVYGLTKCKQCSGKIIITRMGDDNGRMTYFCPHCQNNDIKQRKLPVKNSLLGWVLNKGDKHNEQTQEQWTCKMCTLINIPSAEKCQACDSIKPKTCRILTTCDISNSNKTFDCKNDLVCKDSELHIAESSNYNKKRPFVFNEEAHDIAKKRRIDGQKIMQNDKLSVTDVKKSLEKAEICKIPLCKIHKVKCVMREVRKKGENWKRMFFTCSLPRGKQCDHFQWADEEFPFCEHSKRCVLRTVLKQGPNNGRKFFACIQPKNKQCQFFEWAVGY